MTGTAPELSYGYDTARPTDIVDTKQDIPREGHHLHR